MVITNPFYSPESLTRRLSYQPLQTNKELLSLPLNDVRFHLDGNCLWIIIFIVWLVALNGGYISFSENLIKTSDSQ